MGRSSEDRTGLWRRMIPVGHASVRKAQGTGAFQVSTWPREAQASYAHTGACSTLAPPVASLQMARAALLLLPSASPRGTRTHRVDTLAHSSCPLHPATAARPSSGQRRAETVLFHPLVLLPPSCLEFLSLLLIPHQLPQTSSLLQQAPRVPDITAAFRRHFSLQCPSHITSNIPRRQRGSLGALVGE